MSEEHICEFCSGTPTSDNVEEIAREATAKIGNFVFLPPMPTVFNGNKVLPIIREAITAAIAPLQAELEQAKKERDAALLESSQILADYSSIQGNGLKLLAAEAALKEIRDMPYHLDNHARLQHVAREYFDARAKEKPPDHVNAP